MDEVEAQPFLYMVRTVFLRTAPAQSPAQSYKLEDCLLTISINGEDCLLTISINGEDCAENCSSTVPSTVLQIGGLFVNHFHKW
jgi:hypothetical protein